jgi:hypothetical protein
VRTNDIVLIPEADGARFVQPTDGFRQAYKKWAEGKQHVGDSKRKVVCPTCKKQLTPTEGRTVPFHVGKNTKACRGSNSIGAEWADPYAPAKDGESIWGDEKRYVDGPNSEGEYSAGENVGTAHATRAGFKSREEANKWLDTMLPKLRRASRVSAKDGILSSPLLAMAALLAILSYFNKEVVSPSDYDLTTYKPPKRNW